MGGIAVPAMARSMFLPQEATRRQRSLLPPLADSLFGLPTVRQHSRTSRDFSSPPFSGFCLIQCCHQQESSRCLRRLIMNRSEPSHFRFQRNPFPRHEGQRRSSRSRRMRRLQLECLEDRRLLSTATGLLGTMLDQGPPTFSGEGESGANAGNAANVAEVSFGATMDSVALGDLARRYGSRATGDPRRRLDGTGHCHGGGYRTGVRLGQRQRLHVLSNQRHLPRRQHWASSRPMSSSRSTTIFSRNRTSRWSLDWRTCSLTHPTR